MGRGWYIAVVACLAAEAFGPENVLTVAMPGPFTSDASNEDAAAVVINAWGRYSGGLLVAPALALLFLMNIFPLMWSFGLSFFHYRANRMRPPSTMAADRPMGATEMRITSSMFAGLIATAISEFMQVS